MNTIKKKPRRTPQQFNPLGYTEIDYNEVQFPDFGEEIEDSSSIIEKLQSFDPKTREMATISLAQIEHFSEEFVIYLKDNGVLKLLIQRLVDPNPLIILNSLMALSNIAASGAEIKNKSIADLIIDSGILVLLETTLSNFKQAHEQRQIDVQSHDFGIKIATIDQSYKLLASLAEVVSEESLNLLLDSQVTLISLYFIMSCDDARILTGIGSYLQVITESSLKLCEQVATNLDFIRRLVVIAESSFSTQELKAYILGSLYNFICTLERNNIEPDGKDELCQKVIQGLVNVVGIKIFEEIGNLTKIYNDNKNKYLALEKERLEKLLKARAAKEDQVMGDPVNHVEEDHIEETKTNEVPHSNHEIHDVRLKQALGIWSDSATAIQICLGIIMNMFESEEGFEDDWKEEDENEEEDEKNNPKVNKYEPPRTSFMSNMTHDVREKILEAVIDKCQHFDENANEEFFNDVKSVQEQAKMMVEFGFPCIMNILLNIEYSDKSGNTQALDAIAEQIFKICLNEWKYYLEVLYMNSQENVEDSSDKEDMTFEQNIVRDILKIMIQILQASSINLNLIDVPELMKVQADTFNCLSEESKLSTIELVGTRCHPRFGLTMEENALVADFLMELLKAENVMVIGEALNALFDVYSEESYDEVFVQKGFMDVLAFGYGVFQKKITENKSKLSRENYALLRNHLLNLRRFIKYKQQHIGKGNT